MSLPSTTTALMALALVASSVVACGPPPPYSEVQRIYAASCTTGRSCHGPGVISPNLAEAMSHASTVNVNATQIAMPLITPGSLERSYLWHKINGTMSTLPQCAGANCGTRMPMVGGIAPDNAQIETIRRWILAGAPTQ